jgi:hydrogenase nickel incorporation protein HypA/HybF
MHEVSIAQSVISIVEKSLPENNTKKVTLVYLSIGRLSGIEIEALKFAFSIIKKDSLLKDAEMVIETINGKAICNDCGKSFELSEYATPCPNCESFSLKIIEGKEMNVTHIELED